MNRKRVSPGQLNSSSPSDPVRGVDQQQQKSFNSCFSFFQNNDADDENKKFFPKSFKPRPNDVIVGKGMNAYRHAGNANLRNIINSKLQEYNRTRTKRGKSKIIASIMLEIKATNNGSFVKKDGKSHLWFEAGEVLARDKISQSFRKLSSKSKRLPPRFNIVPTGSGKNKNGEKEQQQQKQQQIDAAVMELRNQQDHTSSINSIDLAKHLISCLPMQESIPDFCGINPYEPVPVSEALHYHNLASSATPTEGKGDNNHNIDNLDCFPIASAAELEILATASSTSESVPMSICMDLDHLDEYEYRTMDQMALEQIPFQATKVVSESSETAPMSL